MTSPALILEVLAQLLPPGYRVVSESELASLKAGSPDDLLTEEQVAEELHTGIATLRKWRTTGDGPRFVKVTGFRAPQYRRGDLDAWKAKLPSCGSSAESKVKRGSSTREDR